MAAMDTLQTQVPDPQVQALTLTEDFPKEHRLYIELDKTNAKFIIEKLAPKIAECGAVSGLEGYYIEWLITELVRNALDHHQTNGNAKLLFEWNLADTTPFLKVGNPVSKVAEITYYLNNPELIYEAAEGGTNGHLSTGVNTGFANTLEYSWQRQGIPILTTLLTYNSESGKVIEKNVLPSGQHMFFAPDLPADYVIATAYLKTNKL